MSRGMVSRGMVSRGVVSRGVVSRGVVSRGMVSRGMVSRGVVSRVSRASPGSACVVWLPGGFNSRVDGLPPEVQDLLPSYPGEQGLRDPRQVAI